MIEPRLHHHHISSPPIIFHLICGDIRNNDPPGTYLPACTDKECHHHYALEDPPKEQP